MLLRSIDERVESDIQNLQWLEDGEGYVDYLEFLGAIITASKHLGIYHDLDRKIVQCAKILAPHFGNEGNPYRNEPWPYHPEAISQGKYPLEKLPAHVRDLARELYYS